MFVAGTKDFPQDQRDDLTTIPTNTVHNTLRYINADGALYNNDLLYPDHNITSLVGHSPAGSVALEIQKQYPDLNFKTTTYGAPVASMTAPDGVNNKRRRNYDDPVSMLDRGSTMAVKDPITLQNDLNIKSPSNIAEMVTKALK